MSNTTYATQADIELAIGTDRLLLLADRDGDGIVDTDVVTAALQKAGATTDTRVGRRYALPLATVPDVLLGINVDLTVYYLANTENLMTDLIGSNYKIALADLDKIGAGKIVLDLPLADQPDGENLPESADACPTFDDCMLGDFTGSLR